jgi:hypothetical protein
MARVPYLDKSDLAPENHDLLKRTITLHRALAHSPNGLRAFDIADPYQPKEVGHFIPDAPRGSPVGAIQLNDVFIDERGVVSQRLVEAAGQQTFPHAALRLRHRRARLAAPAVAEPDAGDAAVERRVAELGARTRVAALVVVRVALAVAVVVEAVDAALGASGAHAGLRVVAVAQLLAGAAAGVGRREAVTIEVATRVEVAVARGAGAGEALHLLRADHVRAALRVGATAGHAGEEAVATALAEHAGRAVGVERAGRRRGVTARVDR